MLRKEDCLWLEYATYDKDGFVNGVRSDAPDEIKKAYRRQQKEIQECMDNGTRIPK